MIINGTVLKVIDKSGITYLKCFKILNSSPFKWGSVGDVVIGSVYRRISSTTHRSRLFYGLVVGVRKKLKRFSGTFLRFETNNVVLLTNRSRDSLLNSNIKFPIVLKSIKTGGLKSTVFNKFLI